MARRPPPPFDPLAGRQEIGGWTLMRALSTGGMGQVWKVARTTSVGESKLGALKLPLAQTLTDPNRVEAFKAEARLTMKLDHPCIARTIDAGIDRGIPYMVMEWVNGIDLASFLRTMGKTAPLAIDVAVHIFYELVLALQYAHNRQVAGVGLGIIHRDVKPSNVLISSSGGVILTDFGIAHVVGERSSENVRGTLRYMAPEQWMGEASQRSDLYALGLILTELLDGHVVYDSMPQDRMVADKMKGKIPPCHRRDIPQTIETIRVGLLHGDESMRIPDADRVITMLQMTGVPRATAALQKLYALLFGEAATRSGYTEILCLDQPPVSPELMAMLATVEAMRIQGLEPAPEMAQAAEAAARQVAERKVAALGPVLSPSEPARLDRPPATPALHPEPDAPVQFRRRPSPPAADSTEKTGFGPHFPPRIPTERWPRDRPWTPEDSRATPEAGPVTALDPTGLVPPPSPHAPTGPYGPADGGRADGGPPECQDDLDTRTQALWSRLRGWRPRPRGWQPRRLVAASARTRALGLWGLAMVLATVSLALAAGRWLSRTEPSASDRALQTAPRLSSAAPTAAPTAPAAEPGGTEPSLTTPALVPAVALIPEAPQAAPIADPLRAPEPVPVTAPEPEPIPVPGAAPVSEPRRRSHTPRSAPSRPPRASARPSTTGEAQQARLQLRLDWIEAAQIRVGTQVFTLTRSRDVTLAPGTYPTAWRLDPKKPWHAQGTLKLAPDHTHLVRVSPEGLAHTDLGATS